MDKIKNNYEIESLKKMIDELEYKMSNGGAIGDGWFDSSKLQEYLRLRFQRDELRRKVSLLQGEETAILLDWPYPWDTGAPIPHVIADGHVVYLIYRLRTPPDPNWDGSTVRCISGKEVDPIAVVKFNCYSHRFGGEYGEDCIHVHSLETHGLGLYDAHEIVNSRWIKEVNNILEKSKLTFSSFVGLKHYFFSFHDDFFECLALDYSVEVVTDKPFCDVVIDTTKKLFG